MTFKPQEGVEWEPVVVPLVAGIDVNTRARLLPPTKLLSAQNAYFPRNGGPEKRKGHTEHWVKNIGEEGEIGAPPADHLYGYGRFDSANPPYFGGLVGEVSSYRHAGNLLGVAKRDDEELAWDGWRLYSRSESGFNLQQANQMNFHGNTENSTAYLPSARSTPFAKTQNSQSYSDCADNGVIRVVAFRDIPNGIVWIKVYDSVTAALRYVFFTDPSIDAEYLRVINCGDYVHVFVSDASANEIYRYTMHQDDNANTSTQELVASNTGTHFDIAKADEEKFLLAYVTSTGGIKTSYFRPNGEFYPNLSPANWALDLGGETALAVGVDLHPQTGEFCVVWKDGSSAFARVYDELGESEFDVEEYANWAFCQKVAVCAAYLTNETTVQPAGYPEVPAYQVVSGVFFIYADSTATGDRFVDMKVICGETLQFYNRRFNVNMVGRPFRVGNVPFIIVCYPGSLQTTYLLMDNHLTPCGKFEYGTASNNTADPWLFSVNYVVATNKWETTDFHCALMYKQRVVDVEGVFHEISTKFLTMNFTPEFRRAQAGRCLYIPGSQLSSYDGERLYEDNFHVAPEVTLAESNTGPGALTPTGEYFYRVYPCHKNAQGEEVRGPAVEVSIQLTGANDTVTLTGTTIPTCRDGTYFLVFRNANAGTLWYLVSDRDPASANCPKNSATSATWTFVDTAADSTLLDNELDPANAENYMQQYSAPACEVIAYGKNRLWVAGGELPSGTILPSRLFSETETVSFHLNLAHSIDRTSDSITALGFVSDYLVAFKEKVGYIVQGDAADNVGVGDTLNTQLLLADSGCVSHNSLVRVTPGLCFQSEGGIRIVDASGSLQAIGNPVDTITSYVVDAVLDTDNRLIKFYQEDVTLVYDYEGGEWTTWTVPTVSAAEGLVAYNDRLWKEDDVYTDGDRTYVFKIRTGNIGPSLGGVHRFRRVIGLGEADQNYTITCRAYYDDSADFGEEWDWDSTDDLNTSAWGGATWGAGFWGDATGTLLYARDNLWRWRHRLARQKASCISIEIIYNGPDKGPVHTALGFEIGRKGGLDRLAH